MKIVDWISRPKVAGSVGILGSGLLILIITSLSLVTPGYSLLANTASALALGQYGAVYSAFLLFFGFSILVLGVGICRSLKLGYRNAVAGFFFSFAFGILLIAIFKMDPRLDQRYYNLKIISLSGKIHFYSTLLALFVFPVGIFPLIKELRKHTFWQKAVLYTWGVLISSFALGLLWFVLFFFEYGFAFKGLFQKIIILNVVSWCFVLAYWLYGKGGKNA